MWAAIRKRLEIFRDIAERPWFRAFIFVWGAVGAWDLTLSQIVPEEYSRNFPKLYQVVGMTAGWLSLWAWLMVGALSLVAGAVEWAFRHKKRYLELLHQPPIQVGDQANFRGVVGDHHLIGNPSDTPIGASVSPVVMRSDKVPSLTITEEWSCELVSWSRLYEEYDVGNGKELRLRFLPDTNDQASDALLLICFGYKCIRNMDSLRIRLVHSKIEYLLARAPGSRQSPIARFMASISPALGSDERDFGRKCIEEGTVVRMDLAEGGRYRLTNSGEDKAKALARDLIERA
jgi:hypothetical protein